MNWSSLGDTSQGGVIKHAIEHAVAQTILSHPVLQAGIVGEETASPYFVHLPTLKLSELISWEHDNVDAPSTGDVALQHVLEARHSSLWPELHRRPGYQFIILSPEPANPATKGLLSVDIVFAFHHAYGDGNSGVILQRTLLQALNNPAPVHGYDPSTHILAIDNPAPLPPPQDALINFKISWSFLFKTLWSEFGPSFLKAALPQPAWAGKPITTHPEATRLRLISFPANTASDILKRCRENSATLTPLVHVIILRSLANRLPESALANHTFTSTTPISLRRLLPPGGKRGFDPDATMGVVLTGQGHRFSSSTIRRIRSSSSGESLIWELTSSLADELKRKVDSLPDDDITALMAWVSDWNERWRKMLGKERQDTWEVSNVGAADFGLAVEDKAGWSVDRMMFSQSANVAGPAFSVSVAGVKGAELAVTVSWQDGIIDEEVADGLAKDLRAWLTSFARTGWFGGSEA